MKFFAFTVTVLLLLTAISAPAVTETRVPTLTEAPTVDPPVTETHVPTLTEAPTVDPPVTEMRVPTLIDAPHIYQGIDYPNGCESVSAVMALRYFGFDISVDTFIEEYLACGETPIPGGIGPDPRLVYLGDPRSPLGWGCYAPVIADALRKAVPAEDYSVMTNWGVPLGALCRMYLDRGIPVIFWATVGMEDAGAPAFFHHWTTPAGASVSYNRRLHCLLLVGYDDTYYYCNDPLMLPAGERKTTAYLRASVERAYEILGKQSVVIVPHR